MKFSGFTRNKLLIFDVIKLEGKSPIPTSQNDRQKRLWHQFFGMLLLIDYLEKGKTINSEYYCNLLDQLDKNIRGLQKKTIIFHQDNARVHTSFLTMVKLNELKYELFEHPPYSPDLAPSDYYYHLTSHVLYIG